MGYVRLKPRRWPAERDNEEDLEKQRNNFKKDIVILKKDNNVDIWFCDESGFEGDPRPRRVIARKGEKPLHKYVGGHIRASVVGAVRPKDGKFVSLIFPYVDGKIFQIFISELNRHIDKTHHNILVMDNASWHKNMDWGVLEPKNMPTYSPFLNPIEELWLSMKNEFFTWFWTKSCDELDDQVEMALKHFMERKERVRSICSMRTFD